MNIDQSRISLYLLLCSEDSRKTVVKGFCIGLLALACMAVQQAVGADEAGRGLTPVQAGVLGFNRKRADFKQEHASWALRVTANWVVDSGDNQGMPFMIIDKVGARVLLFDANGELSGAAPVLLGLALGDDSVPGIGSRKLSSIRPEERITPAGRFVSSLGRNLKGEEILWVDYESALSLHRVVTRNAKERRAARLASPYSEDKRISYGCINVPAEFFDRHVVPAFSTTNGVVYVLPETRANHQVFAAYYAVE